LFIQQGRERWGCPAGRRAHLAEGLDGHTAQPIRAIGGDTRQEFNNIAGAGSHACQCIERADRHPKVRVIQQAHQVRYGWAAALAQPVNRQDGQEPAGRIVVTKSGEQHGQRIRAGVTRNARTAGRLHPIPFLEEAK
jgi:hypothetical protein